MKKLLVSLLSIVIVATLFSFQLMKTQLRVFVIDDLGKYRENVEVTLYDTPEDYNNSKPSYGPFKTDKKGRVIFHGVGKGPYYLEASIGDYSNGLTGQLTETLQEGRINKMNVVISE